VATKELEILTVGDPEPVSGSLVTDALDQRWVHDSEGRWWCSSRRLNSLSWSELAADNGPLTLVSAGKGRLGRGKVMSEGAISAARRIVLAAAPASAAWEPDQSGLVVEGDQLRELRRALGITEAQWRHAVAS